MFVEYRGKAPRVAARAFIAPTAVLIGDVLVGEEASIWFGVVLRADKGTIRIGARSSIQDNAVVHASERGSTRIGNDVTVGHCAVLDDCTIEDGAFSEVAEAISRCSATTRRTPTTAPFSTTARSKTAR